MLDSVEILVKFVTQYIEIIYFKFITVYDQPFVDTQQSGRKWRKTLTKSAVLLVLLNQKLRHLTEKWDYNCFLLTVIHAAMAILLFQTVPSYHMQNMEHRQKPGCGSGTAADRSRTATTVYDENFHLICIFHAWLPIDLSICLQGIMLMQILGSYGLLYSSRLVEYAWYSVADILSKYCNNAKSRFRRLNLCLEFHPGIYPRTIISYFFYPFSRFKFHSKSP